MTPREVVQLVGIVSQIWPSMKINEYTADAWRPLLEDLGYPDAEQAVSALAKTRPGYITVYDIRRQTAKAVGLLPPHEAEALQMAVKVASDLGVGAGKLHPAVGAAYWNMGGSPGFAAPSGVLRSQWAKVYAEACEQIELALLGGDLGVAIEAARRTALAA